MEEIEWDLLYKNSIRIGISPLEFWEYTLHEKAVMYEAYVENKKDEVKLYAVAVRSGVYSVLNGISIDEIFKEENNDENYIDVETKQQELNELKAIFENI